MSSRSYKEFEATYRRGYNMVSQSIQLLKALGDYQREPTVEEYNKTEFIAESGRAGIVTVVAAFDRYFTTRYSECVTPILRSEKLTDGLVELLSKAGLNLKGALELLHVPRPHRRIRNLIDDHFSDYTTQKFNVIDDLFKSIGLASFSDNVQKKANKRHLKTSIERLIRRRHVIVHAGDLNYHGKLRHLDPYDTIKRMKNLKLFVGRAEEIVCNRLKNCK